MDYRDDLRLRALADSLLGKQRAVRTRLSAYVTTNAILKRSAGFLALAAFLGAASTAYGLTIKAENLVVVSDAGFAPRELPRSVNAPITLHDAFTVSTPSGSIPPVLGSITYFFDRHGGLDVTGLPVCYSGRLRATDVRAARQACRSSIVGLGSASALIEFPEQQPILVSTPITLFNGPKVRGQPSLLAHAYADIPVATTFIVPVVVESVRKGVYGYRVEAKIPPIAGGAGHLVSLSFKIGRTWKYLQRRHSYIEARCETGHLDAREEFSFDNGEQLVGSISQPCTATSKARE